MDKVRHDIYCTWPYGMASKYVVWTYFLLIFLIYIKLFLICKGLKRCIRNTNQTKSVIDFPPYVFHGFIWQFQSLSSSDKYFSVADVMNRSFSSVFFIMFLLFFFNFIVVKHNSIFLRMWVGQSTIFFRVITNYRAAS